MHARSIFRASGAGYRPEPPPVAPELPVPAPAPEEEPAPPAPLFEPPIELPVPPIELPVPPIELPDEPPIEPDGLLDDPMPPDEPPDRPRQRGSVLDAVQSSVEELPVDPEGLVMVEPLLPELVPAPPDVDCANAGAPSRAKAETAAIIA